MRHIIFVAVFFSFALGSGAQNTIEVCQNKTTHLIAEEKITYVQAGDPEKLIAEIVPGQANMVRVKALEVFEGTSSLTLVSANRAYSLLVVYADADRILYRLEDFPGEKAGALTIGSFPENYLRDLCSQILVKRKSKTTRIKTRKDGIIFRLRSIYVKQDMLFFELEISNTTNLALEVDDILWWVEDAKVAKATNAQEYPLAELYRHYRWKTVPAGASVRELVVLPKLMIPGQRVLKIELLEKALGNTGRKLSLQVKNKAILKAKSF